MGGLIVRAYLAGMQSAIPSPTSEFAHPEICRDCNAQFWFISRRELLSSGVDLIEHKL